MISRRRLLSGASALGAAFTLSRPAAASEDLPLDANTETISLCEGWFFRLDPSATPSPAQLPTNASDWHSVVVPHTWQVQDESTGHYGVAWYKLEIAAPESWHARFVRIEFEAVYHSAEVFLNGTLIGKHIGKGYTAFTCDLSPQLRYSKPNELLVRVDNSFSDTMLPRAKSFDWASDGGIIRPVQLLVTAPIFIEHLQIDAIPDLEQDTAQVKISAMVRNTLASDQSSRISASVRANDATAQATTSSQTTLPPTSRTEIQLPSIPIASPRLWHFDAPHLYTAQAVLEASRQSHVCIDRFGIRSFEIKGTAFYLNGEQVSLMGVERMAGSHPQFGMAEPTDWIEENHRDLKGLNCIFTRVHWPQDKRVLDFCDAHGILMQEEVPAWGPTTFENTSPQLQSQLETNGIEQLQEMVSRDRNHPCIVAWGLCNEVDGKNPNSRAFARALIKHARAIDPARLLTYASHTLREKPELDMAGEFDFISANEYFGSWYPGGNQQVLEFIAKVRKAFPDKPFVMSEYGWCECQETIPPGDQNRVKIVDEHTNVCRQSGDIAGAIYFDYNDYRTIAGDKGRGAFQQRVHGVVDLYAHRKPSFDALRKQSSPIQSLALSRDGSEFTLRIQTRNALPAYTLRGYSLRWTFYGYDSLPMEGSLQTLAPLAPNQTITLQTHANSKGLNRVVAEILRPSGYLVDTAEILL
jgi:beta-galactosidase